MSGTVNSLLPLQLVLFPALIGALILVLPKKAGKFSALLTIAGAAGTLTWALTMLGQSLEFTRAWAGWGMDFSLKLTAANAPLLVASGALTLIAALRATYAMGKRFYAGMMFALSMTLGALMANNLVAMLFFWQAMWAPVYGMIKAGGDDAWKSSVKAVFTAGFADLMLILGLGLASLAAESMTIDQCHAPPAAVGSRGSF